MPYDSKNSLSDADYDFTAELQTKVDAAFQRTTNADSDLFWMQEALREAKRGAELGEVPVGAVVVANGRIIARAHNRNNLDNDPTAHAEVLALRAAGEATGNRRLTRCELFVTMEPCAMCAGALVHARIQRLVYGARDPKAGAVESVLAVVNHPGLNHRMAVTGGVLAGRCAEIVQSFFRARRERVSPNGQGSTDNKVCRSPEIKNLTPGSEATPEFD